jgi:hypothetical protein
MSAVKRLYWSLLILCLAGAGFTLFLSKSYYPDHPVPGLSKAALLSAARSNSGGGLSPLTVSDGAGWYVYQGNQGEGGRKLILEIEERGWRFKEQMGSGYVFEDNSGKTAVVESQMWTRKYVLFQVPAVMNTSGTAEGDTQSHEPLRPVITINNTVATYDSGSYCWFSEDENVGTCGDPVEPGVFYERIRQNASKAEPGAELVIDFLQKPDKLTVSLTNEQELERRSQMSADAVMRYILPEEEGYYRVMLWAEWGEKNQASYYLGVNILSD